MSTGQPHHHQLDTSEFRQALAILEHEQKHLKPTSWQETVFKLLKAGVYILGACAALLLLLALGAWLLELIGWGLAAEQLWGILLVLGILFYFVLFPLLAAVALLFLLNIPLMLQWWRHKNLVLGLGLEDGLQALWKTERKKKTPTNILVGLAVIVGIVVLVAIVAILGVTNAYGMAEELSIIFFAIIVVASLVATYFMRRREAHLRVVGQLIASLKSPEGEPAVISGNVYAQIARIERDQIGRERAQSILRFETVEAPRFFVQKSRQASQAQAALDPLERLRLQNRIDALVEEPLPQAAVRDEASATWQLKVPETPLEIEYVVDEEARRIRILSVISRDNPNHEA